MQGVNSKGSTTEKGSSNSSGGSGSAAGQSTASQAKDNRVLEHDDLLWCKTRITLLLSKIYPPLIVRELLVLQGAPLSSSLKVQPFTSCSVFVLYVPGNLDRLFPSGWEDDRDSHSSLVEANVRASAVRHHRQPDGRAERASRLAADAFRCRQQSALVRLEALRRSCQGDRALPAPRTVERGLHEGSGTTGKCMQCVKVGHYCSCLDYYRCTVGCRPPPLRRPHSVAAAGACRCLHHRCVSAAAKHTHSHPQVRHHAHAGATVDLHALRR